MSRPLSFTSHAHKRPVKGRIEIPAAILMGDVNDGRESRAFYVTSRRERRPRALGCGRAALEHSSATMLFRELPGEHSITEHSVIHSHTSATMPLSEEDIEPGIIAILEPGLLLADRRVQYAGAKAFRAGPFVCVQVVKQLSLWVHLTRQRDPYWQRFEIHKKWRRDGHPHWHDAGSYVNDISNPFTGPLDAFVAAGRRELPFPPYIRPSVCGEAVEAIIAAMSKGGVILLG